MPRARNYGFGSIVKHGDKYRAFYSLTRKGKSVRGSKVFSRFSEARAWLDKQRATGPAAADTLSEWLDQWLLLNATTAADSSHRRDTQTINTHIRPRLGAVRLRDLTGLRIRQFFAEQHADKVSDSERHRSGSTLRKILNAAVAADLLPSSPMAGVRVPGVVRDEQRVLTAEQLSHLHAIAVKQFNYPFGVLLQADACLRPGELLALTWKEIDVDAGTISVRRSVCPTSGKIKELKTTQSRRTFPLSAPTLAALAPYVGRPEEAVIPNRTRRGHWRSPAWSYHLFRPLADKAGFEWATPYTLRHTGASLHLAAGSNIYVVSRRCGHRDASMTLRVYSHLMPDDQQRAADAFAKLFEPKNGKPLTEKLHTDCTRSDLESS